ncbi:MAG: hypothetical protein AUI14_15755 [Actinobacteria bacterium 13_2_20CM_2_71_6]|nr:MAG: hypothetical protein AUI14_15755 [Actinobacteria bacterium 13_2_20CM_2_71_6]
MQPCQVCGGMAVDPNGYCTQCGTFRGQVTQPVSGTPYPPQQPGYPYQGGQPASGAPWPGPTSATPYPFSGPPVSGSPGYPPVQQPPRRSFVGILIASSVVAVVLVAAIVVLAIVRSGGKPDAHNDPTAPATSVSPAASAAIDTCLIGTWRATSERQQQDYPGVGPVILIGQGQTSHIHADGTVEDDYGSATPYTGSYNGHAISMTVTGGVKSRITTASGTLSFHDVKADGTVTVKVDGTVAGSPFPLSVSPDPVQYTCLNKTATEHTEHYDVTLTKVSDSP